jgi:hypothetical protein
VGAIDTVHAADVDDDVRFHKVYSKIIAFPGKNDAIIDAAIMAPVVADG